MCLELREAFLSLCEILGLGTAAWEKKSRDGNEQEEIPTGSEVDSRNEAGGPRGPGSSCP